MNIRHVLLVSSRGESAGHPFARGLPALTGQTAFETGRRNISGALRLDRRMSEAHRNTIVMTNYLSKLTRHSPAHRRSGATSSCQALFPLRNGSIRRNQRHDVFGGGQTDGRGLADRTPTLTRPAPRNTPVAILLFVTLLLLTAKAIHAQENANVLADLSVSAEFSRSAPPALRSAPWTLRWRT